MSDKLLGLDLGSSRMKASVFDLRGNIVGTASREIPTERPNPSWVQQNTDIWWKLLKSITKEILHKSRISGEEIEGIGICGQSQSPTPIGKSGKALIPCIHYLDQRSTKQVNLILEEIGEEKILKENQLHVDNTYTAPKLLWIKENWSNIFRKTKKFLLPKDVLVFRLTGEFSTDPTDAFCTNMFSLRRGDWSDALLEDYGIPRDKLPEINKPWEIVGEVNEKGSRETNLQKGTPVVAGGADWACTYYGAGGVKSKRCFAMMGTVNALTVTADEKSAAPTSEVLTQFNSIVPELRNMLVSITPGGAILKWVRDELFHEGKFLSGNLTQSELMNEKAKEALPGSGGIFVLPSFGKQRRPEKAKYGGTMLGLTIDTKIEQIIRGIMEGVVYEMRRKLELAENEDLEFNEIRVTGGGGRSEVWRQIIADILDAPVCQINIPEPGAFGSAVLAGVGTGMFTDIISPVKRIVKIVGRKEPIAKNKIRYDKSYRTYVELHDLLEA